MSYPATSNNSLLQYTDFNLEVYVTLLDNNGTDSNLDDKIIARGTCVEATGFASYLIDDWISGKRIEVNIDEHNHTFSFQDNKDVKARNMKKLYEWVNKTDSLTENEKLSIKTSVYPSNYNKILAIQSAKLLNADPKHFYTVENSKDMTNGKMIFVDVIEDVYQKYKDIVEKTLNDKLLEIDNLIKLESDSELISSMEEMKSDLENNVNEFLKDLVFDDFDIYTIFDNWPTLLNPSPFTLLTQGLLLSDDF